MRASQHNNPLHPANCDQNESSQPHLQTSPEQPSPQHHPFNLPPVSDDEDPILTYNYTSVTRSDPPSSLLLGDIDELICDAYTPHEYASEVHTAEDATVASQDRVTALIRDDNRFWAV